MMERAFEMELSDDPTAADKAFAQYKSAILVLREAASWTQKIWTIYTIYLTLCSSVEEKKTIELVKRIKSIELWLPDTSVLMAACLFNQGLFDLAREKYCRFQFRNCRTKSVGNSFDLTVIFQHFYECEKYIFLSKF